MSRSLLALVASAVFAGCACAIDHVALDSRWAPLKRLQRDPSIAAGRYVTRGELVLTADPCEFARQSVDEQNALLAHERVHAVREFAYGVDSYLSRYGSDGRFRHDEEALGWREQIRWLVSHGWIPNPESVASVLDSYQAWPSHEDALAWVGSEISWARSHE